jgi:pimeloyl-ACP methyl ester carboxylesterase
MKRLLGRLAAAACALTSAVGSTAASGQPPASGLLAYGAPHQLQEVAPGRRINLFCTGEGAPTVIFSAGGASWSYVWAWVQPAVAKRTRTCSWDRAGNGFSDASPEPQDIDHVVSDLERALSGARVTGPLILVGHSQGGLESLVFADRHPDQVSGLVLVDPAFPDQMERLRQAAPALMAWSEAGDRRYYDTVQVCIDALKKTPSASSLPAACSQQRRGLPKTFLDALAAWDRQPAYWQTYLSEFHERDRDSKLAINPERSYGDKPVIVLGSGILRLPGAPQDAAQEIPALKAEISRGQQGLAHLSARGSYLLVSDSAHAIMVEKPDVVVAAIVQMVDQTQAPSH